MYNNSLIYCETSKENHISAYFRSLTREFFMEYHLRNLHSMNKEQLIRAFTAIPPGVTSLFLYQCHLDQISSELLAEAFAEIPESVTSLYLGDNHLHQKTAKELTKLFNSIPSNVKFLDLGGNGLFSILATDLATVLAAIPRGVTSVDLTASFLNTKSDNDLATVLRAIPLSVTSLCLSYNDFYKYTSIELATGFAAIPTSITTLSLIGNQFNRMMSRMSPAELASVFGAIPTSVRSLDLGWNNLEDTVDDSLAAALGAIPPSVTSLGLGANQFDKRALFLLPAVFRTIPDSIIWIDLTSNHLDRRSDSELYLLLSYLKKSATAQIGGRFISSDHFLGKMLIKQVEDFVSSKASILSSPIVPPFLIDDCRLRKIIAVLESDKEHPDLANLTCALLLDGMIENTLSAEPDDIDQYVQNRTHAAINFYVKAAMGQNPDSAVSKLANFILWHLKAVTASPSVKERLSEFDIHPTPDFISSYYFFKPSTVSLRLLQTDIQIHNELKI